MILATSYPIGIPFVILGALLMFRFRTIANAMAGLQKSILPGDGLATKWLRPGTEDDIASRCYRYAATLVVGFIFFASGLMAVVGEWNPYA